MDQLRRGLSLPPGGTFFVTSLLTTGSVYACKNALLQSNLKLRRVFVLRNKEMPRPEKQ